MKKIAVVGTRKRNAGLDRKAVREKFFEVYERGDWIVSGGCSKGGDRFAAEIAKKTGIPILTLYPDYERYGRGAPIVRNGPVAEMSDTVVACVVNPEDGLQEVLKRKEGGTEDMLRKFVKFYPEGEVYLV